jgi:hypothetical protein
MPLTFISLKTFCSWLQGHLLPCPFKYITGIDCPGCGFQRAVILLMQGDIHKSFAVYPPAIPLLIFFSYIVANQFFKINDRKGIIKISLFVIAGTVILVSYGIKILKI